MHARLRPKVPPRVTRAASMLTVAVALTAALLASGARPAFAHATLLSVDPQPNGVYDESPPAVDLRFTEPVEVELGGVRVFDGAGDRVANGAPRHPEGNDDRIRSSLPDLDDGTYVVTWRVTSDDGHPIDGAFSFSVGAAPSAADTRGRVERLLAQQGGSDAVGVLYAIDRAVVFAALALLIGAMVFLSIVFPPGRGDRRARRAVWAGWWVALGATLASIGLQGAYAAGLPLSEAFVPSLWADVLHTRYGEVMLLRVAFLLLALPLVRVAFRGSRDVPSPDLPAWWRYPAVALAAGLAMTPGLAGHARTGDHVGLAIVADTVHVLAMSCWLGGLVVLVAVVLAPPLPEGLHPAVNRFSALALGCVAALMVTGGFQAWRQVGGLDALRDTDFGRLLIAKVLVVVAMVVAAAFSRDIVNRTFRDPPDIADDDPEGSVDEQLGVFDDEHEALRLRRTVAVEILFAVVILAITALLVNTPPARTQTIAPVSLTMRSEQAYADVTIAPAVAGRNDIHVTALPAGATTVEGVQVQLVRPGSDVAPFDVPLRSLGPGHLFAPQFDIPFPGEWRMVVRVDLANGEQSVLTDSFRVR